MSTVLGPHNKDLEEGKLSTEDAVGRPAGKGSRKLPEHRHHRVCVTSNRGRGRGQPSLHSTGHCRGERCVKVHTCLRTGNIFTAHAIH